MDIASDPAPLAAYDISQADALRHLHVRDAKGQFHKGAVAFLVIWRQLRYWKILAAFVGVPFVRYTAITVYNRFADYRFARLDHCQIAQNKMKQSKTR